MASLISQRRMRAQLFVVQWAAVASVVASVACGPPADTAAPVASASVEFSQAVAEVGGPIDLTYQFVVAEDAPAFAEDYWVFVHFVDRNDQLLWSDDHQPVVPTTEWQAGTNQRYTRTMFIPRFPETGEVFLELGLYSPATGERLPLTGDGRGGRSYRVGSLTLILGDVVQIAFDQGWHDLEVSEDPFGAEWQWSRQEATLSFRNPGQDAELFLQLDQPVDLGTPQSVDIRIGPLVVDSFPLVPGIPELRRVYVPAEQFGDAEEVTLTVSVDHTFVPAAVPGLGNTDSRELGARVFRAFVRPL